VVGKSSGGYGALMMAMLRPELVAAVGSHAGDSAFDVSYLGELPRTVLALEKRGGVRNFLAWFDQLPHKPPSEVMVLSHLCCAATWSPRASGPYGFGEGFDLPIDLTTGAIDGAVWGRWLAWDPVRMLDEPRYLSALRQMRAVFLDAGLQDEFFLQLGTRQIASKLRRAGIAHVHEEFEGGHSNTPFRYDRSFEVLTRALASA
jgi:enterochelin esterase family protein